MPNEKIDIKDGILNWVDTNAEAFNRVRQSIPEKDYHHQLHLIPSSKEALPITFRFGEKVSFLIKIGEHTFSFDESATIKDIEPILASYLLGNYYVLEKRLYNKKIATELVIKGRNNKDVHAFNGDVPKEKLELITERKLIFLPVND